ncbi:hypothetical protein [Pontibacter sp. H249]|uniref:hypothetical protein n=1 Tax=Pontibacter sp. H249 TaxID=3133420 RepID=UPI0030BE5366
MTPEEHKRFVYLSILWCRVRARFLASNSRAEKKRLRDRKEKIEAEQEALLQKEAENGKGVPGAVEAVAVH